MLLERYGREALLESFAGLNNWRPFPAAGDRAAWCGLLDSDLGRQRKAYLEGEADAIVGSEWPVLTATEYMEFERSGDRKGYEEPYFLRRERLAKLILAECANYEGRYLDEIANGLWQILGEMSWCVPAHAGRLEGDPLVRHDWESVDLFACETAMVLAEGLYLLGSELEGLSVSLCERVRRAILERVIVPFEQRDDFWWLAGRNNWTPWCCSNVVGAAMYLLEDNERLADVCVKAMRSVDLFIGGYGEDGGCDEGPAYWAVAAGAMFIFLELLYSRSAGKVTVYDEPLIAKMGEYIVNAHLCGQWFLNFADAPAKADVKRAVTYQYGVRVGEKRMCDLAMLSSRGWDGGGAVEPVLQDKRGGSLTHALRELWWFDAEGEVKPICYDEDVWLGDLQVMVCRESEDENTGLILAAKGGHNDENHNHNDVGSFVLCFDGEPGLIDIGVERYCKKTFSSERYDIWCIRSSGHNVPILNGYEQRAGQEFCAVDVVYERGDGATTLGMDLQRAYPAEAKVERFRREFVFERGERGKVRLRDSFKMAGGAGQIVLPLYFKERVELAAGGKLAMQNGMAGCYDEDLLQAELAELAIEDERLRMVWGESIWQVKLSYVGGKQADCYELVFGGA